MKKNWEIGSFTFLTITVVTFLLFGRLVYPASIHCDFNSDGFDDLAIGVPLEGINGHQDAGAVNVIYGKATGLSAANNQFWNSDSPNVPGNTSFVSGFGWALSCGDFNGDGNDDLAIGAPFSTINGFFFGGSVTVLYGKSKWRLSATGSQFWTQNRPGIKGKTEEFDEFGYSLAAGDFNGDGFADLAIGVPGEGLSTELHSVGAVQILYGGSSGLSSTGNQFWTQDSPGIAETAEVADQFGTALVAADFGKDTASGCYDDLAIGVPSESNKAANIFNAGGVNVLYGSASGLSASGNEFWDENTPGIQGTMETNDDFGEALAAGNFRNTDSICGDKKIADLVVGAPLKQSMAQPLLVLYLSFMEPIPD